MMRRRPSRERAEAVERGKPHCSECRRLIVVGAGTRDRMLCEYCLIIDNFNPLVWLDSNQQPSG